MVTGWPDHWLGWLSLVVIISGIGFAAHSWAVLDKRVLTVQWMMRAALW